MLIHHKSCNQVTFGTAKHLCFFRCYVSVAVLDGLIYAMGGYDGQNRQNTAEKYFPKKNQWSLIQPMNFQRSDASATAFESMLKLPKNEVWNKAIKHKGTMS